MNGDYYNRIIQTSPATLTITAKDIDEILIYSGAKMDAEKSVKIATCASFEHGEGFLRIEYENIKSANITCSDVKGRVYHYCIKNNLLDDNNFCPNLFIVENIQQYTDIKVGRLTPRYVSIMSKLEDCQKRGDWVSIIKLFPDSKNIQASEFWDDVMCLSKLSFALSNLAMRARNSKEFVSPIENCNYDKFFLKVSKRCLELDPDNSMHISSRAYYYYTRYLSEKKNDLYQQAFELYEQLIPKTPEWYKEKYRFAKLRQKHIKLNKTTGYYSREQWSAICRSALDDYRELIESYENLDDHRKKKYHKIYLKALFGYSTLNIDASFNFWDDYIMLHIFGVKLNERRMNHIKLQEIVLVDKHLQKIYSEMNCDDITRLDLDDDPNYFELQYRIAQVEQIKGIVYVMKNKSPEEYLHFFEESNKHIDALLLCAKELKKSGYAKFNFPYYAKPLQAINLYFLGRTEESHKCFYNAKTYMLYEEACIYTLCKDYANAIRVISEIPERDTCYNKAQKLLTEIQKYEN